MFSVRSLFSAAGTASRIFGTYVHYPTNGASHTPLSSFLRRALSTTPDSDTSGSHSTKKKIKMMTINVEDNPINISPKISSIKSSHSADLGTSASAKSFDTQSESLKPMDRDVEIRSLKDTIKNKDAVIMRLSEEIASATKRRDKLLEKEVLTINETNRLRVIEEEDLPDMRKREDRLVTEIAELKAELSAPKHPKEPADALVQGI